MTELDTLTAEFEAFKSDNPIFDCNCWLPVQGEELLYFPEIFEEMIRKLEALHIDQRVFSCKASITQDTETGNAALFSKLQNDTRCFCAPVIAPEFCVTQKETEAYIDHFVDKNKAVILRAFPRTLHHSMEQWQTGRILAHMEGRRIPLMLWHTQVSWDEIDKMARSYPRLSIIIDGSDRKLMYENRNLLKLLYERENVYLETHSATQFLFLETLINKYGIDRIVFGSNYPYEDPNAPLYMVFKLDCGNETKSRILRGNLQKLIGGIIR